MRVAVDARMIGASGIGRYLRELLGPLLASPGELRFTLLGDPAEIGRALGGGDRLPYKGILEIHPFTAPIYSLREQLVGSFLLDRLAADVLFFPNYNAPVRIARPCVVTVHDLTHLRYPERFGRSRSRLASLVMARALHGARRVVTSSEASRQDLARRFPAVRDRVRVIPAGVSPAFAPADPADVQRLLARLECPPRYLLSVGIRKPHKNLGTAAAVVAALQAELGDLGWVVVGRKFSAGDELERSRPRLRGPLLELQDVGDDTLRLLYSGALALLMPSDWEGFGLPALEAMACGTPVVASDIPALREVVGTAGILRAPRDVEGLRDAVRSLVAEPDRRETLRRLGLRRAREFRWDRSAALLRGTLVDAALGRSGDGAR